MFPLPTSLFYEVHMFKFSQLIATKKQAEQQTTATRFRALMTRAALRDDLKPDEAVELGELNEQTGFHLDLTALATAMCEHKTQTAIAAGLGKAEKLLHDADQLIQQHDADCAKLRQQHEETLKEWGRTRERLTREHAASRADRDRIEKARVAAEKIACTHWQYFDKPSPEVTAAAEAAAAQTKRDTACLVYGLASLYQSSFGQTRVIEVESIWNNPSLLPDFDTLYFIPYKDQSQQELDELIVLARRALNGERLFYISRGDGKYPTLTSNAISRILDYDALMRSAEKGTLPMGISLVRRPGQAQSEVDDFVQQLEAAVAKFVASQTIRS
jgi:hypothetical protein